MKTLSIEGKIVNHDESFAGRVEIDTDTGLITRVGPATGIADLVVKDEIIFPGFVDLHVHAREDITGKFNYREDFETVSWAAIHGGVVHIADMPNNPVPPVDEESYQKKRQLAEQKARVDVTLYAGIGQNTSPLSFPAPYKVFLSQPPSGSLFFNSKKDLEETLARYSDQAISFHCEDPDVLERYKNAPTYQQQRPVEAENLGLEFVFALVKKYQLKGRICHLSTSGGLEKIAQAKKKGLAVTAEVTPHHLFFDQTMITEQNEKLLQMNPPLRSQKDRFAMLEGLRMEKIDYLASDHAPYTLAEKAKRISGLPNLDTYGAFVTWLMKEQGFTPRDVARICSYNPGLFVNQFISPSPNPSPQGRGRGKEQGEGKRSPFLPLEGGGKVGVNKGFGYIAEGYVGSLTIINLEKPWTVKRGDLKTKCGWSPFEGITFPGNVTHTIIRGKVYEHK